MRGVRTWTETHSDAVLVTANDIGKKGWLEVWTRMPRGSVIDVTPAWQQRQLRYQEYRRPAVIAAAIVFFAGLVVLASGRTTIRHRVTSRPPVDVAGPPDAARGKRAVEWRLVDEIVPNSKLEAKVAERAKEFAAASKRNGNGKGIALTPIKRIIDDNSIRYGFVSVDITAPSASRPSRSRRRRPQRLPISTA